MSWPRWNELLPVMTDESDNQTSRTEQPRRRRRLSDKIMIAFHAACDQGDFEVAHRLIAIVEFMLRRPAPEWRLERRIKAESLVAAHERLWSLRHPEAREG